MSRSKVESSVKLKPVEPRDKMTEVLESLAAQGLLSKARMIELYDNKFQKPYTQSEIFTLQHDVMNALASNAQPGRRTDLEENPEPTVPILQKVGSLFQESREQVRKRAEVFNEAKKNPEKYAPLLKRLDANKTSLNTAHKAVTQRSRSLPVAPLPSGTGDLFLVDIPEKWNMGSTIRGSADNHYDTMTPEELRLGLFDGQDIRKIFAPNAIMFFWISTSFQYFKIPVEYPVNPPDEATTNGETDTGKPQTVTIQTPTYQAILDSWGFDKVVDEYVWVKDKMGMGSRSRSKHEKLLVATKGEFPTPAKLFESVIMAPRDKHSRKPLLHEMLEEMYPVGHDYHELFARPDKPRDGWTYWGNESG